MPLSDADITKMQLAMHNELNNNPMLKLIAERAGRAEAQAALAADQTRAISRGGADISLRQEVADSKTMLIELAGTANEDAAAVAQQVATIVAPVVRDAVVEAVRAGGTPEAVAEAVVSRLGAALRD